MTAPPAAETSEAVYVSEALSPQFTVYPTTLVPGGTIIVRQRGTRVKPGLNVGRGKDDTLFAKITGRIKFLNKGSMGKFVMVEPMEVAQ